MKRLSAFGFFGENAKLRTAVVNDSRFRSVFLSAFWVELINVGCCVHNVGVADFARQGADELDPELDPVVRDLMEKLRAEYERIEATLAEQLREHFEASYGGVEGVGDRDGGLHSLWLSPDLMAYSHLEVERRLNVVLGSLRDAAAGVADEEDAQDVS